MVSWSGRRGVKWRLLPLVEFAFRAVGRRWVDFYAWMLNRQERNNTIAKVLKARKPGTGKHKGLYDVSTADTHVAFLKRCGLKPEDFVLDFGCGFGRTAIPLLRYLEPGRYLGVEISAERIRMAHEYVALEGLDDKRPRFVVSLDLDMPYADDESVDAMWALTVASHMPLGDLRTLLGSVQRVLRPGGWMVFDFIHADGGERRSSVKDFEYPADDVAAAAREAWLSVEHIARRPGPDFPPEWDNDKCVIFKVTKP